MTSGFIILFLVLLPVAYLGQRARSRRLARPGHLRADAVEAAGLALGISLGAQGGVWFPQWPAWLSFSLLMVCSYFPLCAWADRMRGTP